MEGCYLGLHTGEALIRLASTYPTLLEVILETVQNSLDTNSTEISILINFLKREIVVTDNGDGVTKEKFQMALNEICKSQKPKTKLGRFGIGLISPLGKCERFIFTSTPKENPKDYNEWVFVTADIPNYKERVPIPLQKRSELWFSRTEKGKKKGIIFVPWRTQVKIERFVSDRVISKLSAQDIKEKILERFGNVMKNLGTKIKVLIIKKGGSEKLEFEAPKWPGTALPVVEIFKGGTRTNFYLFIVRGKKKKAETKVLVGEHNNPFRLSFSDFIRSLPPDFKILPEAIRALNSGFFVGEITNTGIKLSANRRGFEPNEALLNFCEAINEWYEKQGKFIFEEVHEEVQFERYQKLGLYSLMVIERLLPEHKQFFNEIFRQIRIGSIGEGHFPKKGKPDEAPALSVDGFHTGKGAEASIKDLPKKEKKDHHPLTVETDKGKRRTLVRRDSVGLQLNHEVLEGSRLWVFDRERGILTFNVRHPLWVKCDEKGDSYLIEFQNFIILQALEIERIGDENWKTMVELAFEEINPIFVSLLLNKDYPFSLISVKKAK